MYCGCKKKHNKSKNKNKQTKKTKKINKQNKQKTNKNKLISINWNKKNYQVFLTFLTHFVRVCAFFNKKKKMCLFIVDGGGGGGVFQVSFILIIFSTHFNDRSHVTVSNASFCNSQEKKGGKWWKKKLIGNFQESFWNENMVRRIVNLRHHY